MTMMTTTRTRKFPRKFPQATRLVFGWALSVTLATVFLLFSSTTGTRAATAAATPDFSGNWQADLKASDFGPMGPPDHASLNVTHKEPEITIHAELSMAGTPTTWEATCKTDGKECKATKGEVTLTVQWQGESLVLNRSLSFNGTPVKVKEIWNLSADGKTLTSAREVTADQGSFEAKVIFTKS